LGSIKPKTGSPPIEQAPVLFDCRQKRETSGWMGIGSGRGLAYFSEIGKQNRERKYMKRYMLIAASMIALVGCQKRESTGSASANRETGAGQSSTYNRSQTNASARPSPSQSDMTRNRADQTAIGTPGQPATETGTQRSTQPGVGASSDQAITRSVKASLQTGVGSISSDMLKKIDVSASNGRVTLKGSVNSDTEKQQIEKQVKQIPGVQSVDNQLKVGPEPGATQPQSQTQGQGQTPSEQPKTPQ
jgi:osmotically-inducible protein OsmY